MNTKSNKPHSRWQLGGRTLIQSRQPPPPPPEPQLSQYSTPGVRDSVWCSTDFLLGAGMVIIQQNTHKIVVVYETKRKYWFFPRGRKDVGESIEAAALREAYEESGYRVQFLPLYNPTRQPSPPDDPNAELELNVEPLTITLTAWSQIPEDAVREAGTGMSDEQNYESHLLSIEEAMARVWGMNRMFCDMFGLYIKGR
ncbi:hypothetical protein BJ912DRAFT_1062243 [Pholiota molesta]|nr:hypothetical protein BJ912DRAFT_1062243 [Pholiota molesta]